MFKRSFFALLLAATAANLGLAAECPNLSTDVAQKLRVSNAAKGRSATFAFKVRNTDKTNGVSGLNVQVHLPPHVTFNSARTQPKLSSPTGTGTTVLTWSDITLDRHRALSIKLKLNVEPCVQGSLPFIVTTSRPAASCSATTTQTYSVAAPKNNKHTPCPSPPSPSPPSPSPPSPSPPAPSPTPVDEKCCNNCKCVGSSTKTREYKDKFYTAEECETTCTGLGPEYIYFSRTPDGICYCQKGCETLAYKNNPGFEVWVVDGRARCPAELN